MFSIELIVNKKNKNSTANSGGVVICETQVLLKSDTSIIHPTFQLDLGFNGMADGDSVVKANYIYCEQFNRSYWINDIKFISADVVEISCTVDALASFCKEILDSEAYVNYSNAKYNALIPDRRIPMQISNKCSYREAKVTGLSAAGVYVLYTASSSANGRTGLAQGYMCTQATLSAIAKKFFDPSIMDKIADKLYSPLDAIFSCMWLPCESSLIQNGSAELSFGEYTAGSYPTVSTTASSTTTISVILPYRNPETGAYDWRNIAPYTKWYIWLPGVGYQEFPMELCLDGSTTTISLEIKLQLSPTNGGCSYTITCNNIIVMSCKGNLAVNLPVAKSNNGLDSVVSQSAGALTSLGIASTTLSPIMGIAGAVSALSSGIGAGAGMLQHSVSASGAISGLTTPSGLRDRIRLYYASNELALDPFGDVKDLIGCPVFKKAKLNDFLTKKVFCSNINFKWTGDFAPTNEEYDMIRNALTSPEGVWIQTMY